MLLCHSTWASSSFGPVCVAMRYSAPHMRFSLRYSVCPANSKPAGKEMAPQARTVWAKAMGKPNLTWSPAEKRLSNDNFEYHIIWCIYACTFMCTYMTYNTKLLQSLSMFMLLFWYIYRIFVLPENIANAILCAWSSVCFRTKNCRVGSTKSYLSLMYTSIKDRA